MGFGTVTFQTNTGSGGFSGTLYARTQKVSNWYIESWRTQKSTSTDYKITSVDVPTSLSPAKTFLGYYYGDTCLADSTGTLKCPNAKTHSWVQETFDVTATDLWESACPCALIEKNSGTGGTDVLAYDSTTGKWYLDYPFTTEFDADHPITIPTRTCYRFLGCYSTNGTSGIKYINADGTPTAAFLALAPTDDITIYAQWERVSYKVTLAHSNGSPASTVFYAKIGATGAGRFYADDLCTTQITGIAPPQKELWQWQGSWDRKYTESGAVQYVTSAGAFTSELNSLAITADTKLSYSNYWEQVSVKLTLSGPSWTIPTTTYYIDRTNGGVYADWLLTTPLTSLPIPSRAGYRFLGYYNSSSTSSPGTQYVDASGNILSALTALKSTKTICVQGRAASYTLTLDPNGGATTEGTIYYDATSGATAFFGASSAVITSVTVPTYTGNSFLGYFTAETGGTQVVAANGSILSSWVPTESGIVYAQWGIDVSIIDVDAGDGSGGTSRFWHRTSTGKFYSDAELTTEITSISVPSLRLYNLNGLYTEGGVLAVNASGVIQSTFNPTAEFVTLTAMYTRFAYETKISNGGGAGTISAIYRAPSGSTWYSDLAMTTAVTNVGVPTRTGYRFGRYVYGSTTVIDSSGNILSAAAADEDYTASAVWGAKTYTLTFDGNGATPSYATKTVTYNQAIGTLPTLSNIPSKKTFDEWRIGGIGITAATVWTFDGAQTAIVAWESYFGNVKDYFNLASANLIPESSDSGDTHQHTCAYNATSESPATETSAIWRNPRVTYRVVGQMTLNVTLGDAFKATIEHPYTSITASGYMISSVEVHTAVGEAPSVTVSAVANEGFEYPINSVAAKATPAIKTYAVSIPISPRHRPQNLLSAINGGGELQELTLIARGDPVVLAENGMPCASDMTHGRIEVTARTAAYNNETAPAGANGFTTTAEPQSNSGTGYKTFSVTVRKELV